MANSDFRRAWLPELWQSVRDWHRSIFPGEAEHSLSQILPGTLTALLVEQVSPSADGILQSMAQQCSHVIDNCPDVDLYQCNPIQLTLVIRLIERVGAPVSIRAIDYLNLIGDAINDGSLFYWQVPAFELLVQRPLAPKAAGSFDLDKFDNYAGNFGQILGQIEGQTGFGTRAAGIEQVPQALLYAGASRAISRNDIAGGARALRCLNYVTAATDGFPEMHHLFDAICARQEPEGHFGDATDTPAEKLRRAFECLWVIAEVSTPYRLFMDLTAASRGTS